MTAIVKVGLWYDFSKLFIDLQRIVEKTDDMAEYCGFLLESIAQRIPFILRERKRILGRLFATRFLILLPIGLELKNAKSFEK